MINNNHKNTSCQFAELIVSYLYEEADAQEKSKFEAHVENCSFCTDELADFGFVRASVLEWRDTDFSNLTSPFVNIPAQQLSMAATRSASGSWFAEIKKLFVFRPALAVAAFTVMIFFVGITLLALNFSKVNDVAEIDRNDTKKTVPSPTVEQLVSPSIDNFPEKPINVENNTAKPKAVRQTQTMPVKSTVKVSNRPGETSTPTRDNKEIKIRDKKLHITKQPVPNLNEIDDVEDKSIRLADLFEEIGTE